MRFFGFPLKREGAMWAARIDEGPDVWVRLPVDARATLVDIVLRFEGEGAYLEVPCGTEVFDAG